MADFDELKDKEYPENISEEDTKCEESTEESDAKRREMLKQAEEMRAASMMCVYAGPDYFRAKAEKAEEEQQALNGFMFDPAKRHRNPTPEEVNRPPIMFVYAAPPLPKPGAGSQPQPAPQPVPKMKFCHECGTALSEGFKFCPNCGTKVFRSDDGPKNC